jgi:hypothetical protein
MNTDEALQWIRTLKCCVHNYYIHIPMFICKEVSAMNTDEALQWIRMLKCCVHNYYIHISMFICKVVPQRN